MFGNATCRCDAYIHYAGEGPGWVVFCDHLNRSATKEEIEKFGMKEDETVVEYDKEGNIKRKR